jgi:hypothetical protein
MIFHKHVFAITSIMCIALVVLYLPVPIANLSTNKYRTGCFTCRCKDQAGKQVILGPVCNYQNSMAQDMQSFACDQTTATEQCQELSAQQNLELVSAHAWQA